MITRVHSGPEPQFESIGREGAAGGIVSHGSLPAFSRITVRFAGPFARLPVARLEAAKARSRTLAGLFARYADCLLAQILQSTACNATHSIEQRAAKWIIAAAERTGPERVPLTHEQLGMLLGVGRSYASRVVQKFKAARLVETRRKAFLVKNAEGLRGQSLPLRYRIETAFQRGHGRVVSHRRLTSASGGRCGRDRLIVDAVSAPSRPPGRPP
jgi:hypothetical protein